MDINLILIIIGSIANGILLPTLIYFIKELRVTSTENLLMREKLNTMIEHVSEVSDKLDALLQDNTINKESLTHLKGEMGLIRKKIHNHSSILMALELKIGKLENRMELNEK